MMSICELRNSRIAADYKDMLCIKNDECLSWEAKKGKEPYIEEYLLHVKIKTYSFPNKELDHCDIKITLPRCYPDSSPHAKVISNPTPYNPKWFPGGVYGGFYWHKTDNLLSYIYNILMSLQYSSNYLDPQSPSNHLALMWYLENKNNTAFFPSDNVGERFFAKYRHIIKSEFINCKLTPPKKQIEITISNIRGATVTAQLENTMTVDEVIEELIGIRFVEEPEVGTAYTLHSESYGFLHREQTFEECSVKDGDNLSIVSLISAYGCPNSENVPGLLPNCMLNDFDTIEILQL